MRIQIVTDTNSGMTPALAEAWGVGLVPMPVMVEGVEHLEGYGLTHGQLYARMKAGAPVSTSQPGMGALLGLWERLLEHCDELVYIPMSSALSNSMSTAKLLAEDYAGRVHVVDNRRISVPQQQAVRDALHYVALGLSGAEICRRLEAEALYHQIYVTVDQLEYLKRGGRITPATAMLGTALGIKPILSIQGGPLDACAKVRGIRAARAWILRATRQKYEEALQTWPGKVKVMAAYSETDPQVIAGWIAQIQEEFPDLPIEHALLPLSICCHTGPGALATGVCYSAE